MANFYAILTEDTPVFTITAGMEANIIDAAGAQTINVAAGGELELEGALGANRLNLEGNIADYTVTGDGAGNMTFTHTATGAEVVLAARDEAQRIMFNDGAADLAVDVENNVVLGDQIVTNAAGDEITITPTGPTETPVTVTVSDNGTTYNAVDTEIETFTIDTSASYTYNISGFELGVDKIVMPVGTTNNNTALDNVAGLQWAQDGVVVEVNLVGLTDTQDQSLTTLSAWGESLVIG